MRFVVPIPRADVAEAFTPLLEELAARKHDVVVVIPWRLEMVNRFSRLVSEVRLSEETPEGRGLAGRPAVRWADRLWRSFGLVITDLADRIEKTLMADRLLLPGAVLVAYSNDAVQLRPFMNVARFRRRRVATMQMTFLYANARDNIEVEQGQIMASLPRSTWLYRKLARFVVGRATGVPVYDGPRRIWGSDADSLYVINDAQAKIFEEADIPREKIVVTGAPFMDMIVRRMAGTDATSRDAFFRSIGVDPGLPSLLLTTRDLSLLLRDRRPPDWREFTEGLLTTAGGAFAPGTVLVKPHPAEDMERYERLIGALGIPSLRLMPKEMNIVDALALCDAHVSVGISSPTYYAQLMGIPQVLFRFRGAVADAGHAPNFADMPQATEWKELAASVASLRGGGLRSRTESAAGMDERFDGHAASRIVDDMERRYA
jgi:hypothetical protein